MTKPTKRTAHTHTVDQGTVDLELERHLDELEVAERADEAAQLDRKIRVAREELADMSKRARAAIKSDESTLAELLDAVRTRRVRDVVTCAVELHPAAREVVTVRQDTGEIVRRRPARGDELQVDLITQAGEDGPEA